MSESPETAPVAGPEPTHPKAGLPKTAILRNRADFLRAAAAFRQGTPGFLLQARERRAGEPAEPGMVRIGFTCSKKVGNAVTRNRAKRRLRAIARLGLLAGGARPGWDYVLIGRPGSTVTREFIDLQRDLERALRDIHSGKARKGHPGAAPYRGKRRGKGADKAPQGTAPNGGAGPQEAR